MKQEHAPQKRHYSTGESAETASVNARKPSASHGESRTEAPTYAERQAHVNHEQVVEDVEAVMARIDDMVASISDLAVQAA